MRQAKYAGTFYEKAVSLLDKQITESFLGEKGPGALPSSIGDKKRIRAVISPHAGYSYSGQCAAWSYKNLCEQGLDDLYIIIGPIIIQQNQD